MKDKKRWIVDNLGVVIFVIWLMINLMFNKDTFVTSVFGMYFASKTINRKTGFSYFLVSLYLIGLFLNARMDFKNIFWAIPIALVLFYGQDLKISLLKALDKYDEKVFNRNQARLQKELMRHHSKDVRSVYEEITEYMKKFKKLTNGSRSNYVKNAYEAMSDTRELSLKGDKILPLLSRQIYNIMPVLIELAEVYHSVKDQKGNVTFKTKNETLNVIKTNAELLDKFNEEAVIKLVDVKLQVSKELTEREMRR